MTWIRTALTHPSPFDITREPALFSFSLLRAKIVYTWHSTAPFPPPSPHLQESIPRDVV